MHCYETDILVIGAGPAGACAAYAAARAGARVVVLERRATPGTPVQCAEYVPAQLVAQLITDMDLGKGYVVQSVEGMKTFLPGGGETLTPAPGRIIRRDQFDQSLVRAARNAGAQILCSMTARSRNEAGDVLCVDADGQPFCFRVKVIIGADGPRSIVGKWVGAVNTNLLPGVQYTMKLSAPLRHTEIYLDPDYRAGYAWCFPKGDVANVGLGFRRLSGDALTARQLLDAFAEKLRKLGKVQGNPLDSTCGWIPAEPVRRAVHGNVLLAGDAAGQTHPVTGAGIFAAVSCGFMAGECAAEAVRDDDPALLEEYEEEWRSMFEDTLARAHARRVTMDERWDEFQTIISSCWVAYRDYYQQPY